MMKVIVGVGFAMIVWISAFYFHILKVPKPQVYQYITFAIIAVVQPSVIYWTIKRNYESSNHLREPLEITVDHRELSMKGQSFYTEIAWNKVFKIEEEKKWFLIYQNNLSAILISKKDLSNNETQEFNDILSAIPDIPKHLK
jgi:hypothetical protein